PEKNEATNAEEISGDAIAVRPPTAAGPRKRGERRAAKKANDGGKGIDKTTARGAVRAQHAVPLQPPSV
ncbi:MAG: hypothetical protein V3S64_14140, partial [bacterium]